MVMFKLPRWLGKLKWKHKDLRKQRTTEEQGRKPCSVISLKCGTDIRIHKIDQWYRMEIRWMHQITYLIWGDTEDQRGEKELFNKQCQEKWLSIYIKVSPTLTSKPTSNGLKIYQGKVKPQSFFNNGECLNVFWVGKVSPLPTPCFTEV